MRQLSFALPLILVSCALQQPAKPAEPVKLTKGTSVPAVLMANLESGEAKEGDAVPFLVVDDVRVGNAVVVPKGTAFKGKVAWSRGQDALDAISNRPARLEVQVVELPAVDGKAVKLAATRELKEEEHLEFNRQNTGLDKLAPQIAAAVEDPKNAKALEALGQLVQNGSLGSVTEGTAKEELQKFTEAAGMSRLSEALTNGNQASVEDLMKKLQSGQSISLAGADGALPLDAVIEVVRFAGQVPDRIGGMFKGRNIRAYIGTPVTVYVREDLDVIPAK